jgi:hypothetical protein
VLYAITITLITVEEYKLRSSSLYSYFLSLRPKHSLWHDNMQSCDKTKFVTNRISITYTFFQNKNHSTLR